MSGKQPEPKSDPLRFLTAVLPSLLTLIGVGGLESAGLVEVRDRYQWAADLLVWISVLGCVVAIVTASYPYLRQPPFDMIIDRPRQWADGRRERRAFERWIERWRRFDELMSGALRQPQLWEALDAEYARLRDDLTTHQGELPRSASKHVRWYLSRQWDKLTALESRLDEYACPAPLWRRPTLREQVVDIFVDSQYWDGGKETRVRAERTLRGVWDGLNDYSVRRGWGAIGAPAREPDHAEQPGDE